MAELTGAALEGMRCDPISQSRYYLLTFCYFIIDTGGWSAPNVACCPATEPNEPSFVLEWRSLPSTLKVTCRGEAMEDSVRPLDRLGAG